MSVTELPPAARDLVNATLARARLPARERAAVCAELEAHFRDGFESGVSLEQLIQSYGDPVIVGALIGRAKRRARPGVGTWIMAASATLALAYIGAVVRLETAPSPPPTAAISLDAEAATVMQRAERAEQMLVSANGVVGSYAIASELRSRHTLWGETESVILLDRTLRAADTLLDARARAALADSLALLDARETLLPRRGLIDRIRPLLVDRLYGRDGRVDRSGLRLIQRTKGVERLTVGASLLEPLYFARGLSRARIRSMVDASIRAQLRRADASSAALVARLHPRPS